MFRPAALTFVNGTVIGGDGRLHTSVRVRRGRIDAVGAHPTRGDVVIDLHDAIVVPGLINAHDHLELNSFGRLKWRAQYANVREWIADFQPRFARDPQLAAARPATLRDRLWAGGLKNLLSGVTTVAHHNPLHAPLRRGFPVRVVRNFGMSHSLQIDGPSVAAAYARTPSHWPWIIHAAEGVDVAAGAEIDTLCQLSCLGANTVLVHGVGIDDDRATGVLTRGAALVWCPSSNHFLFGRTADVRRFNAAGRLALGTDSRLSGEGDLLDELRAAHRTRQITAQQLVRTVTTAAATALRLKRVGTIAPGHPADLAVLRRVASDPYESVVASARADVRLTMIDGEPLYGSADLQTIFDATGRPSCPVTVDGGSGRLAAWIGRRVATFKLREPGLEMA